MEKNSSFELFIKEHLSESRKQSSSTPKTNIKTKRLTNEVGFVLTSQETIEKMKNNDKDSDLKPIKKIVKKL